MDMSLPDITFLYEFSGDLSTLHWIIKVETMSAWVSAVSWQKLT